MARSTFAVVAEGPCPALDVVHLESTSVVRAEGPSGDGARAPIRVPWENGSTLEIEAAGRGAKLSVVPRGAAVVPDLEPLLRAGSTSCRLELAAALRRRGGELLLAGRFCGGHEEDLPETGERRGQGGVARWRPNEAPAFVAVPIPEHAWLAPMRLHERPNGAVVLTGRLFDGERLRAFVAELGEAGFRRLTTPFENNLFDSTMDARGTLWVHTESGLFAQGIDGQWLREPLERVTSIAWRDGRPEWAVADDRLVRREGDGAWRVQALPAPAFSDDGVLTPKLVSTSPDGSVWLTATYREIRRGFEEGRRAVLRLGGTGSPVRCERGRLVGSAK